MVAMALPHPLEATPSVSVCLLIRPGSSSAKVSAIDGMDDKKSTAKKEASRKSTILILSQKKKTCLFDLVASMDFVVNLFLD